VDAQRIALALALAVSVGACGGESGTADADPPDLSATVLDLGGGPPATTWTFRLDAGVLPPGPWPSVLVYAPSRFRLEKPVHVVVWLHGLSNCIENVVRTDDGECTPDAGVRRAYDVIRQFEAAGRNALLVVPELGFDTGLHDPGSLATPGGTRALLAETLADLRPYLGQLTVEDLAPIMVAAHSAGHVAAAAILHEGSMPVSEMWHLDSLYDEIPVFVDWVLEDLQGFRTVPSQRRFADVYTPLGGTEDNSETFADTAEFDWLPDAGAVYDDRTYNGASDEQLRHGLVFKLSGLSHEDVGRLWFVRLVATANLPAR
jgi:hypothetical protein